MKEVLGYHSGFLGPRKNHSGCIGTWKPLGKYRYLGTTQDYKYMYLGLGYVGPGNHSGCSSWKHSGVIPGTETNIDIPIHRRRKTISRIEEQGPRNGEQT